MQSFKTLALGNHFKAVMRLVTLMVILALAWSMLPKSVHAQDVNFIVATGGTTGTYHAMFRQFNEVCGQKVDMTEQNTNGSLENLALLLNNKVNAAIIQEDVLFLAKRTQPKLMQYKTLFALHPEEVHMIALAAGKVMYTEEKTMMGLRTEKRQQQLSPLTNVTELMGKKVGSFGGSMRTTEIFKLQSDIGYQIFDVGNAANGLKELRAGNIDALVAVGGQPLDWLGKEPADLKLLEVSDSTANKVKDVYQKAGLSYLNLGSGGQGVQTVTTSAVFVAREYKTPEYVKALAALRTCFQQNLNRIAEKAGSHPKWSDITAGNKGNWHWMDLPGTATPAVSQKRK